MEEAGGTSEPQQGRPRGVIVVGILLLVALVGIVAWVAGGGDDDVVQSVERADERFPEPDHGRRRHVRAAATRPAPCRRPVPATPCRRPRSADAGPDAAPRPRNRRPTAGADRAGDRAAATTPPPATDATGDDRARRSPTGPGPSIGELVPIVAAFAEPLTTPEAVQAQIDQLLAAPATTSPPTPTWPRCAPSSLLDGPIEVEGRWERDGHRVLAIVDGGPRPPRVRRVRRQRRRAARRRLVPVHRHRRRRRRVGGRRVRRRRRPHRPAVRQQRRRPDLRHPHRPEHEPLLRGLRVRLARSPRRAR